MTTIPSNTLSTWIVSENTTCATIKVYDNRKDSILDIIHKSYAIIISAIPWCYISLLLSIANGTNSNQLAVSLMKMAFILNSCL